MPHHDGNATPAATSSAYFFPRAGWLCLRCYRVCQKPQKHVPKIQKIHTLNVPGRYSIHNAATRRCS